MKANSTSSRGWTWQIGYLVGVLLFVMGAFSVYIDATTNFSGYTLVVLSLLILLVTAWTTSNRRFKSNSFSVGSALLVISLVFVGDMFQEMLYDYPGWNGNGFLLDGFATMLYLYIVPVFVLVGVILLVKDPKSSLKR